MENIFKNPILYDGYIAFPKNETLLFHYGDSEEYFQHNLQTQPIEWKYRDSFEKLTYSFDKHGFRNDISLDDISQSSYIVTIGCSHTMGCGQYNTETYSYYLQNMCGLPVYNMGLTASCNEVSSLNISWLLRNYHPPKAIVFQKANINRFATFHMQDKSDSQILFVGPWVKQVLPEEFYDLENVLVIAAEHKYVDLKSIMAEEIIKHQCASLGIQLITLDFELIRNQYSKSIDLARDLLHCGPNFNMDIANLIFAQLDN